MRLERFPSPRTLPQQGDILKASRVVFLGLFWWEEDMIDNVQQILRLCHVRQVLVSADVDEETLLKLLEEHVSVHLGKCIEERPSHYKIGVKLNPSHLSYFGKVSQRTGTSK
jgi:hypothetical protein